MVGINTILRDDPRLDIRDPKLLSQGSCRQPIKIIVDSILKTPLKARIFDKGTSAKIIIVTTQNRLRAKECMLRKRGAHIIKSGSASNMVDVRNMMKRLMRLGIANILVEGGGELAASLLKERLVDRLYLFIAPIIIGGRNAITSFEGKGTKNIRDAFRLKDIKVKKVGRDFLIEAEP
jgi:diaminohydroxyphosphoribosylaminopyrimidine deaminase/5-amino-6-(5-phosphoribosylamino)uracil reductase